MSIAGVSRIRLRLHLTDWRRKSSCLKNICGELWLDRFWTYFRWNTLDFEQEGGSFLDQIKRFGCEPKGKVYANVGASGGLRG